MLSRKFGTTLRELRAMAELSQEELALKAKLHRTYISQMERGLKNPTLGTVGKLADIFKIKISKLLAMTEDRS